MIKKYPLFINGKWIDKDDFYEDVNPFSGEVEAYLSKPDKNDIKFAIGSVEEGFEQIKNLHAFERADILERTALNLEKNSREIAHFITVEVGKAHKYSLVEVSRVANVFKFAAE